jgi:hypothetical protein
MLVCINRPPRSMNNIIIEHSWAVLACKHIPLSPLLSLCELTWVGFQSGSINAGETQLLGFVKQGLNRGKSTHGMYFTGEARRKRTERQIDQFEQGLSTAAHHRPQ